ncbi:MAG: hypothetical protein NTU79_06890 [Planctomycetota bacterium]|nr:hypothetical protein [Planctomycetota bacterium]
MIRTDEELKVVREQLSRAESALESLRRDVLPKNERMVRVMSESYVDTILELRGHVDTFLGIKEKLLADSIEPASDETDAPQNIP